MKKRIQLLAVAVAFIAILCSITHEPQDARADGITLSQQIIKTNTSTTVPVAIAAASKPFRSATFFGFNSTTRDANTGTVYIGITSGNNTQPIAITTGSYVTVEAPAGKFFDLADWYLDVATVNDGVVVIYSW
jgi:hypothetical protein